MSVTPSVPPKSNNAADKRSEDHKESSSPRQREEAEACPLTKEFNLPAADIGNKQGQDHRGCPVAQHGSCHQTHEQPTGADSVVEGVDGSRQHQLIVTSNKHLDHRQARKDIDPNDQEGSSHTHQHGHPGVASSAESQDQEGRQPSRKSDHKDRKVSGTSQGEKEGRRPSRKSQDQDGRRISKSSVHGDKEGRRSSRTSQGQDGRRTSSGASHHGRRVSGAASGLEVMAELGHSKDKPHRTAEDLKKGGWGRLNSL